MDIFLVGSVVNGEEQLAAKREHAQKGVGYIHEGGII